MAYVSNDPLAQVTQTAKYYLLSPEVKTGEFPQIYNYPISTDTACICFLYCFRIGNRLHIIAASLHTDPRRQTLINTPFLTPQFTTVLYLSVHRVCDSLHSQRPDSTYRGETVFTTAYLLTWFNRLFLSPR